jgi:UDP-N-acetylmuramoyl-tripeptide--D-alanyl-D-alanine ligase
MIELLVRTPASGRRILAAGEMLELGPSSAELHREAGRAAGAAGNVDWIIGVQGDAESLVRGAIKAGHPADRTKYFPSSSEAAQFIASLLSRGDLLLVKGSRGVKMERIVEALDAQFTKANPEAVTVSGSTSSGTTTERG